MIFIICQVKITSLITYKSNQYIPLLNKLQVILMSCTYELCYISSRCHRLIMFLSTAIQETKCKNKPQNNTWFTSTPLPHSDTWSQRRASREQKNASFLQRHLSLAVFLSLRMRVSIDILRRALYQPGRHFLLSNYGVSRK